MDASFSSATAALPQLSSVAAEAISHHTSGEAAWVVKANGGFGDVGGSVGGEKIEGTGD